MYRQLPAGVKAYVEGSPYDSDSDTLILTRACTRCGVHHMLRVKASAVTRWMQGELVMDAFPEISAEQRELFFLIPGFCGICWEEMFAPPVWTPLYKCEYCKYDFDNYAVFGCESSKKRNVCSVCCDCCGIEYVNGKKCFYYTLPHPNYMRDKYATSMFGDVRLTRRGKIVLAIALLLFVSLFVYFTKDYMWFDGRYQKIDDVIKHMPKNNPSIIPEYYTP